MSWWLVPVFLIAGALIGAIILTVWLVQKGSPVG